MSTIQNLRSKLNMKSIYASMLMKLACGATFSKSTLRHLRPALTLVAVLGLSGCADMSQFAGAVGGAAAEFTCALLELAFGCEV